MTHKIAVSIINYRTGALTLQCVRSVLDDLGDLDARIIIVDNCSGDGSAEQIENWIKAQPKTIPVKLIRSPSNSGFSGGHNQGINACQAEFYLILNSDAVLRPGFFKAMLKSAEAQPQSGLFVPRLEDEHGVLQPSCFRFHSPFSELIRGANSGPVTRLLKRYQVPLASPPNAADIEWASFACILARAEMIREIGPMDEGYFLYFEDAEYSLRAHRAGWKITYVPEATTLHYCGGSGPVTTLKDAKKRLPAYFYSSRTRFLYQAHGWVGLIGANILWSTGRALAQLRRLLGKPVCPAAEKEPRDIWINTLTPLGARRAPHESQ